MSEGNELVCIDGQVGLVAEGIQELHSLASNEQQIIAVGYSGDIASNEAAVWHRLS